MLTGIALRDFQSLEAVDLDLPPFTVVVGQSSSGKSALVRALQLLTSNASGTSYIRRGAPHCLVAVSTATSGLAEDDLTVTIVRGKDSRYMLEANGENRVYSKIGTGVPEEVSAALGIPPKDELTFASQFDRPFLLDESGGQVATILSELTDIASVLKASHEANRQRLEAMGEAKRWQTVIAEAEAQMPRFATLVNRKAVLDRVDAELDALRTDTEQQGLLQLAVQTYTALQAHLDAMAIPGPVTDTGTLVDELAEQDRLERIVSALGQLGEERFRVLATAEMHLGEATRLVMQYGTVLQEAGVCPTCGQDTRGSHGAH